MHARQPRRRSSSPPACSSRSRLSRARRARLSARPDREPAARRCTCSTACAPPASARRPSWATARRAPRSPRCVGERQRASSPSATSTTSTAARSTRPPSPSSPPTRVLTRAARRTALGDVASARDSTARSCASRDRARIGPAARDRGRRHVGACLLGPEAADGARRLARRRRRVGRRARRRAHRLVGARARGRGPRLPRVLPTATTGCCARTGSRSRASVGSVDDASLVDTEIQGPAVIHPTARLRSTLVRGPAVIGAGRAPRTTSTSARTPRSATDVVDRGRRDRALARPRRRRGPLPRRAPDDEHHRSAGAPRARLPPPARHARRRRGRRRGGAVVTRARRLPVAAAAVERCAVDRHHEARVPLRRVPGRARGPRHRAAGRP